MLHDGDVLSFYKKGGEFMGIELSADGIAYLEVSEDIDRKDLAEALEGQKR